MSLPQKRISVTKLLKYLKSLREALLLMERKRQSPNRKKKNLRPEGGQNADKSLMMELEPDSRGRVAAEGADLS